MLLESKQFRKRKYRGKYCVWTSTIIKQIKLYATIYVTKSRKIRYYIQESKNIIFQK